VNSLPKTVTRQRRGCDLNPGNTTNSTECDEKNEKKVKNRATGMQAHTDHMQYLGLKHFISTCRPHALSEFPVRHATATAANYCGSELSDIGYCVRPRLCCVRRYYIVI